MADLEVLVDGEWQPVARNATIHVTAEVDTGIVERTPSLRTLMFDAGQAFADGLVAGIKNVRSEIETTGRVVDSHHELPERVE